MYRVTHSKISGNDHGATLTIFARPLGASGIEDAAVAEVAAAPAVPGGEE